MDFEWDKEKALTNHRKHSVTFLRRARHLVTSCL